METYFQYDDLVEQALAEDIGWGDITTDLLISPSAKGTALIKAKAGGVLSGTDIARLVFFKVDPGLSVRFIINNGDMLSPNDIIARIEGNAANILKAERTALNFLQHLSGIATQTSLFVEKVKDLHVKIVDTRKTTAGMRILEKQAVLHGGGFNHRINLAESILIKNNHLSLLYREKLTIREIMNRARIQKSFLHKLIEIEVKNIQEATEALDAGADIIMLDNMNLDQMSQSVKLIAKRAIVEASGGISLDNVRAIAETGVDIISVGALTHSAKALDINLTLN